MAEATKKAPPKKARPGAPRPGSSSTGAGGGRMDSRSRGARGARSGGGSFERQKPEFDQKIISIRRVTRVVAGGRRMSFAVSMIIGDKKGQVGLGTGKAGDTSLAIAKAMRSARKNLVRVGLTKEFSLRHGTEAKYGSSKVMLMPNSGKGLVSGSSAREILILLGARNVTSKFFSGTKNKLNNARATMEALKVFKSNVQKAHDVTIPVVEVEEKIEE